MENWSWSGCDGKKATVEVYARAHHVSLFVNDVCVGTKQLKNECKAFFHTEYHDGTLKAVSYDENNRTIAEKTLKTAGKETILTLQPESKEISEADLIYIRMKYTDQNGEVKPMVRGDIRVSVEGGRILGIGSACPYYERGYQGDTTDTYYGEAMAIIKPEQAGKLLVKAESPYGKAEVQIAVVSEKIVKDQNNSNESGEQYA